MADVSLKLGLDQGALQTGLRGAQGSVQRFAGSVTAQLAGAFAVGAILARFAKTLQSLDRVGKLSQTFGVSAESLQRLGGAAELSGGSMEEVAKALGKVSKAALTARQGSKETELAFNAVGISVDELKSLTPEQLFLKAADGLSKIQNPAERAGLGMALFGKSFAQIAPLVQQGGDGIQALGATITVASDEAVAQAQRINDAFTQLSKSIDGLFGTLAVSLGPLVEKLVFGLEQISTAAGTAFEIIQGKKSVADFGKDQRALRGRQVARAISGASDQELSSALQDNELLKENVGLEKQITAEIERRAKLREAQTEQAEIGGATESKEQEKNAKALDQLKADFRAAANAREKRLDDEAHQDRMRQIDAELAKMDEAQKQKEQDRSLAAQGLDALIAQREAANPAVSAIASSLQQIGGGGGANLGGSTADTQLDELRALRNQLKEIEQRVPDTLDEIKDLLARGGATLS
jgi:hypothetical protein